LDVPTSARLITNADLIMTSESLASFGALVGELQDGNQVLRASDGSLEKMGPADLRLNGRLRAVNQNVIDVREGCLEMHNRTAEGSTLDVRVHGGATLSGGNAAATAGLIPGLIRVEADGTLDPGDDGVTGVLSIVGDFGGLELKPESRFQPMLGGSTPGSLYDQIRVSGTVELGDDGVTSTAVLAPILSFAPSVGDLFFVIDNDAADPIHGVFEMVDGDTLIQGGLFNLRSAANGQLYSFEIGYTGDAGSGAFLAPGGNDVVLRTVAVTEPASIALAALALVCLIMPHGTASFALRRNLY
jgi:hypothetical protein